MTEIEKLDKKLYDLFFNSSLSIEDEERWVKVAQRYWNKIRNNNNILQEAIKFKKDASGKDVFVAPTICDFLLSEFTITPKDIYAKMVNEIYSSPDLARFSLNVDDTKDTFLLMTLWNDDIDLTEEQKAFAVSEAMNQYGTVKYFKLKDKFMTLINESGLLGEYKIDNMEISYNNNFEHGKVTDDIRYYILRNHNWSLEEKRNLILDFYMENEFLANLLLYWNNRVLVLLSNDFDLTFDSCYNLDSEYILDLYKDNIEDGEQIVKDIELCKLINSLVFSPIPYNEKTREFIYS